MSVPGKYNLLVKVKKFFFPTEYDKAQKKLYSKYVEFYRQFIPKGSVCYDIGANFGSRTKIFLELGAKVIALEPQEICYKYLVKQYGRIAVVLQKGAGPANETRDFFISDEHTALSSFSEDWLSDLKKTRFADSNWNRVVPMELTTLDELIEKYGTPSFIKIDVEGFELEVLKGLTQGFSFLSFEYAVPEKIANVANCLALLESRYDNLSYNYSIQENAFLQNTEWLNFDEMSTFIQSNTFIETFAGDIYVKQR